MKEKLLLLLLPRLLFSLLSMDGKVHSISATEKQKSERMRRRRRWKRSFYLCLLHSHTHKQTDRQSDKPKEGSPIRSWRAICNRFLIANNNARLTRWWCVCVSFRFVSSHCFCFCSSSCKGVCVCVYWEKVRKQYVGSSHTWRPPPPPPLLSFSLARPLTRLVIIAVVVFVVIPFLFFAFECVRESCAMQCHSSTDECPFLGGCWLKETTS